VAAEVAGSAAAGRRLLAEVSRDPVAAGEFARLLASRGIVDFDGLIDLPLAILRQDPDLAAALAARWPYISVDEYQDTDAAQYALVRLLAGDGRGLTVIGDPDQAIYGFRGADVGFFLSFSRDYPGTRTVALTRNYRSSPAIVAGAMQAVAPATLVPGRRMGAVTSPGPGAADRITVHEAATDRAEASWIALAIDKLLGGASFHSLDSGRADGHAGGKLALADMAVLYRTDAQARALGQALTRAGLPFQKRSHDLLARRTAVPEILREMSSPATAAAGAAAGVAGADQAGAGLAAAGVATAGVATAGVATAGVATAGVATAGVATAGVATADAAAAVATAGVTGAGKAGAGKAGPGPVGPDTAGAGSDVAERLRAAVRRLAARSPGGRSSAGQPSAVDLLAAGEVLAPLARRCGDDFVQFLTEISLGAEADALDPRADAVSLLTVHAAKGLEFSVVFVAGCERDLLPLWLPGAGRTDLAEERRLLFVAMTRARTHLFLTCAARRRRHAAVVETGPSPFLAAIDPRLLDRPAPTRPRRAEVSQPRLL
jgi:superfamily I DNA/RNA helicase